MQLCCDGLLSAPVESTVQTAESCCLWRVMGHRMPEDTGGSGCTEKDEVISEATRHTPLGILPQTRLKWSYSTRVWQGYQSSAQKQKQSKHKWTTKNRLACLFASALSSWNDTVSTKYNTYPLKCHKNRNGSKIKGFKANLKPGIIYGNLPERSIECFLVWLNGTLWWRLFNNSFAIAPKRVPLWDL